MANESARFWAERSKTLPFNTKAHRKWGKEAQWISGEGPYASLCFCPSYSHNGGRGPCLTIQLYETLDECLLAQFNLRCGSKCSDNPPNQTEFHQVWDLSGRGYRRIEKRAERLLSRGSVASEGGAR